MNRPLVNVAASVRQRLYDVAQRRGEDFQLVLVRYALERFLYRLAASPHSSSFILKGALLFSAWTGAPHRATRDLDMLGRGENAIESMVEAFRNVCLQAVEEDGLEFDTETMRGERIREDEEYEGVRVRLEARLGSARIPVQIDVGFGDAVTPGPVELDYPTLLELPAPHVRAYSRETVVAEKVHAIAVLGISNTRLKDFYDLLVLARTFAFEGTALAAALAATFERRRTAIPSDPPIGLTRDFAGDNGKTAQWRAFLSRSRIRGEQPSLEDAIEHIARFVLPPLRAAATSKVLDRHWPAGGPWRTIQRGEP